MKTTDVKIQKWGAIFIFHLLTSDAKVWIEENTNINKFQYLGDAVAIDHRYAEEIADGLTASGLTIK